jgi:Fic family protein
MTMFNPKYTITNPLSINMRKVGELVGEFNSLKLTEASLVKMESNARAISTFSSTSIEGNPLALTDVKKILKSSPKNILDTEKEVLNYNSVLQMLDEKIKKGESFDFSHDFICKVQSMVVDNLLIKNYIGKYRQEPVFVNDPVKQKTVYLPPDAKDVYDLMNELIEFLKSNEKKVDPLILAGIFHKQMVIIHPFMDGNGRTTRLLTKVLLVNLGINTFPLFSFENFYNNNVSRYFQNVGLFGNYYDLVKSIDFTTWLEYFVGGILDELERVKLELPKYKIRLKSHQKKIIDYIEKNGSISSEEYSKLADRARSTRIKDFKELVDLEIISPVGSGKSTYYVFE